MDQKRSGFEKKSLGWLSCCQPLLGRDSSPFLSEYVPSMPSLESRRSSMIWESRAQSRGSLKTKTASIFRDEEGLVWSTGRGSGRWVDA